IDLVGLRAGMQQRSVTAATSAQPATLQQAGADDSCLQSPAHLLKTHSGKPLKSGHFPQRPTLAPATLCTLV
ncbi:hypothetical protein VDR27_17745, partial [Xanthomonas campestris pv. campestris]|nr:hypothetical protein [Xanthomonas campestris pv. campestris]